MALSSSAVRMKLHWDVALTEKSFQLVRVRARPPLLQKFPEVVSRRSSEQRQERRHVLCSNRPAPFALAFAAD